MNAEESHITASTITLTPEVADAVERFILAQTEKQTPNDVVNALLADRLTNDGFLPYVECPPEIEAKGECE